ncbi:hypothetical protein [Agromyces humi]|uniref:hypothetical protein n=1 Tax=Agromyces humi TaxID=1766800 RepID=UPI00135C0D59|nr:hypothetical protein [Agromyces humi]
MASLVTEEIDHVLKDDGTPWPFALNTGDRTVYADTLTDLAAELIPGYAELPDSYDGDVDAFIARVHAASMIANRSQAQLIAATEWFDLAAANEEVATALLAPRGQATNQYAGNWDGPVPLVLVSTDYAPYTDVPLPTGDVSFIDPTDEQTFIHSLADLYGYDLMVHPG